MSKIPNPIVDLIDANHERRRNVQRPHLGVSQLGIKCERALWLSFRWAVIPEFPGRVLRMFRRGQREEETVVSDLRAIGTDIGKGQNVDFGSHVSGTTDGTIFSGLPDAPKTKAVLEIKTASKAKFDAMMKDGLEKANTVYWVQVHAYMLGAKIDRCLFYMVCKDDDRIYTEWVRLDKKVAEAFIARGKRIALTERIPPPISTDPTWWECKLCNAYAFCHKTKITQEVNCRTCANSTPLEDSTWSCARSPDGGAIPVEFQRTGCESHALHPDLVPWKLKPSPRDFEAVYEINGVDIANGEPDAHVFGSKELLANPSACVAGMSDEFLQITRVEMGARVCG